MAAPDRVDERLALAKASPAGLALYADPRRFKLPPHLALLNRAITEAIAEIVTLSAVIDETGEEDRIGPRVMVFMPPRHGKSLLTSQYTPAYFLGAFPHLEVIVASYMQDLATDWGRKSREILEAHGPAVFGAHIQQTARAASRWLTTAGGGYRASGAGSSITGRGANLFIIDDPLKDQEQAQSQLIRDKQWEWYLSTVRTRLMPGGGIFLIMTRWHEDDLAGRLLKQQRDEPDAEQWKVLCLPAIAEPPWDGETREGHPLVPPQGDLLGREPGEALWPAQYGRANLGKIESTIGIFWWSALYQQRPAPAEGFLFKRRDFRRYQEIDGGVDGHQAWKVMRTEGEGGDYIVRRIDVLVFSTIDVAASEKETADYTVVTTWAYTTEADLLVLDVARERFEGPTQVELVKGRFAYWDHAFIGVERNLYGAELIKQTRRGGLPVRKLEADTDKITRALPAAVRYQGHQVFHPVHAKWLDDFEGELLAFPNAAHDDQVDTVAYAVKLLPDLSVGAAPQKLSDGPQEADRYGPLSRGLDTSDV